MGLIYRAERDPAKLLEELEAISALADGEKEALGFLPVAAFKEAIEKHRLVAMRKSEDDKPEVIGFILFGGIFPNARIQQIVVAPAHRRAGIASTLIRDLVSLLESQGYLTVSAAVASDLPVAQAFYERNGFVARHSRAGGLSRKRTIVLRIRDLETESLFSILDPTQGGSRAAVDLGLRQRSAGQAPLFAIDLNVLFDIVKNSSRPRLPEARRLIGAALAHNIRLAVAPEFVAELEREARGEHADPILKLARSLPRLPAADRDETERLASIVHDIVFVRPKSSKAGSVQALSDARHLAQAALARASGYVTSDSQLLEARESLLRNIGIDVASLDEFVALLPVDLAMVSESQLKGTDCTIQPATSEAIRRYLASQRVPAALIAEFCQASRGAESWSSLVAVEAGEVVAAGALIMSANIDAPARVLVHVRSDHIASETFADYLLDTKCYEACRSGPTTIELASVPGQSVVRRAAILRGFLPLPGSATLIKVALGRPVTKQSWAAIARQTRRRTGLRLPESYPDTRAVEAGILIHSPEGKSIAVRLPALEEALGPTILIWGERSGVVVPITKGYADDLLGTGAQIPLFGSPEAAFVGRRTYFNSPRTAALMQPGAPILFYESRRSGGRGAVVAGARIVDATILEKRQISERLSRRAVVEDLDTISASSEVLATTFDNLLRFPSPVLLGKLRELGAVGSINLQTATVLSTNSLSAVLELGWSRVERN